MPASSPTDSAADQSASECDHRVWLRFPSRQMTYCQPAASDDELCWSARVRDVSRSGLRLLAHHKFEQGTVLKIGSAIEGAGISLVSARVVYIAPSPEGKWTMGCTFIRELSEEELLAWLPD